MMADSSDQYESVLCVKPEVHVYRIPPRSSNRGYRSKCVCTLMCVCSGELFAQAPVDQYPGIVVEAVTDSSRYFVIRIEDGNVSSGRHAFIGIGFADRGDSFDFNVALQDHFKWVKQESELARQEAAQVSAPKLDLGFKEGQTIKINIGNIKKKDSGGAAAKSRPMGGSLLPPPPGVKSSALVPPPAAQQTTPASPPSPGMILEFGDPAPAVAPPSQDLWGDFTAAGSGSAQDSRSGWVQF
ncbi:adaptin ear-binding coat-associated protein 2 [Sinocyclocheilus anshuiensis]|uniref:adaptin ear-binding coat-associated protein 2 n=1 Tax=Sinocyclocheilus anshuiensis TaxID=1608454 RepID=UPI0007B7BDCB|nr:PREDICTED: adaptin ear-binding coat-associated protein 2-like [Sinocyclocheilus anshuiensis]